jgi:hypothetical protein
VRANFRRLWQTFPHSFPTRRDCRQVMLT